MLDEATVLQITSASNLNSIQVYTCKYSVACEATFPGPTVELSLVLRPALPILPYPQYSLD